MAMMSTKSPVFALQKKHAQSATQRSLTRKVEKTMDPVQKQHTPIWL